MLNISTLIALASYFWHLTVQPGMINEWVAIKTDTWPDYIKKPLYECPTCLAIWWGALMLVLCHITKLWRGKWLAWCLVLAGASSLATLLGVVVSACRAIIQLGELQCE